MHCISCKQKNYRPVSAPADSQTSFRLQSHTHIHTHTHSLVFVSVLVLGHTLRVKLKLDNYTVIIIIKSCLPPFLSRSMYPRNSGDESCPPPSGHWIFPHPQSTELALSSRLLVIQSRPVFQRPQNTYTHRNLLHGSPTLLADPTDLNEGKRQNKASPAITHPQFGLMLDLLGGMDVST
ncbi:uncharacterized protein BP01DRAFT_82201 [Aspergillus saccharolyticus JOP 1030-1]|uniref:Uncharacterized protein n=1 Tax=Aspergillus saccharolyticus JOP 1030-1 TaxID=1450539 RepID=A0A318ZAD1_9EURO|nr:hypothetical protein BP01DRAFT_82201 [Aspergillus saccharolyticus JOP 1030-1]PYH44401.1 hypothetical protein BP01DRAFT_82201 [Aspergillus saccharolyticus JOP 1030-1]